MYSLVFKGAVGGDCKKQTHKPKHSSVIALLASLVWLIKILFVSLVYLCHYQATSP